MFNSAGNKSKQDKMVKISHTWVPFRWNMTKIIPEADIYFDFHPSVLQLFSWILMASIVPYSIQIKEETYTLVGPRKCCWLVVHTLCLYHTWYVYVINLAVVIFQVSKLMQTRIPTLLIVSIFFIHEQIGSIIIIPYVNNKNCLQSPLNRLRLYLHIHIYKTQYIMA